MYIPETEQVSVWVQSQKEAHTYCVLVCCVCVCVCVQVLTATMDGDVLLWDKGSKAEGLKKTDKKAIKALRLHSKTSINIICATQYYIITGGEEGFVRFYDYQFRLVAWFEGTRGGGARSSSNLLERLCAELRAGPITSISFVADPDDPEHAHPPPEPGESLVFPDFLIGTAEGLIVQVEASSFDAEGNVRRAMCSCRHS